MIDRDNQTNAKELGVTGSEFNKTQKEIPMKVNVNSSDEDNDSEHKYLINNETQRTSQAMISQEDMNEIKAK